MLKNTMVIISGAALAVSLPIAALAVTTEDVSLGSDLDPVVASQTPYQDEYSAPAAVQIQVEEQVQAEDQVMTRQRLRVHIETGPPEGFEPVQQRLHQHDQQGMGIADGQRGNPDAPRLGDGTGECLMEDGPVGTGPYGPVEPGTG